MKPISAPLAAALLALGAASSAQANPAFYLSGLSPLAQKVGCWDACEALLEAVEEAREDAREAAEDAAEEYAEELEAYGYNPRRAHRQPRALEHAPKLKRLEATGAKASDNAPAAKTKKDVAVNTPATCKQYSPATGMLLSLPCE
jgi:phosphoglycerate dehydrogenase-like enzyme